MFKYLSLPLFFFVTLCAGYTIPSSNVPPKARGVNLPQELEQWGILINEFLVLIKLEELMSVVLGYLHDPEVVNFAMFVLSAEFHEMLMEFLSIDEFKEINAYLESKGYDLKHLSELLNSISNAQPYKNNSRKGMNGLLQDLIETLPIDAWIKLFQSNLETSPAFADLFETLNSEEFIDILKRVMENEKFLKLVEALENHGFSVGEIFVMIKNMFGDKQNIRFLN